MLNLKKAFTSCEDCMNATYSKCKKCFIQIAETMKKQEEQLSATHKKRPTPALQKSQVILEVKNNYQRYLESRGQTR